jgi:hypothetical protein
MDSFFGDEAVVFIQLSYQRVPWREKDGERDSE